MFLSLEEQKLELQKNKRRIVANCTICKGTGFVTKTNEKGDSMSFVCDCMKKVERNVRLLDGGFPRKFLDDDKWSLELIEGRSYYKPVKKYIDNFLYYYDNGTGLFLHGQQGRGKTTIECIIAKAVVDMINPDSFDKKEKFRVAFSMYDDILRGMIEQSTKDLYNNLVYKSDLLIIDNVGNEFGRNEKQYSQRTLEMILRKRDNDCLPTIISTNYNIDEIEEKYNKDIKEFILQNDKPIFFPGNNYRLEKAKEMNEKENNNKGF